MFIKLHHAHSGEAKRVVRVHTDNISHYDGDGIITFVHTFSGVIEVTETPEEIDQALEHSYIFVKNVLKE